MAIEVYLPKMSDHMEAGEIVRWLVSEGASVEEHQPILELMTDKVVAQLEAPAAGVLRIRPGVLEGVVVPVGETIALIAVPDEVITALSPLGGGLSGQPQVSAPTPQAQAPASAPAVEPGRVRATPAARAAARQLGVDLARVEGTGPDGRVREEDVRAFFASRQGAQVAAAPVSPTGASGAEEVESVALTSIQRLTGERMLQSVQQAPQFALSVSVDATELLLLREAVSEGILSATGEKPSVTAILVKLVAEALRRHPRANASYAEGRLQLHRQINVGVGVGTEQGLVVPVIKEADRKSLAEVVLALKEFREKAKAMRFGTSDLSGGTFTISNLGMYGVDSFTAIVNPPESAILAVGRIVKAPVGLPDDSIALRPTMSLTLSVDHRSVDGVQAARFLAEIKAGIEKPDVLVANPQHALTGD